MFELGNMMCFGPCLVHFIIFQNKLYEEISCSTKDAAHLVERWVKKSHCKTWNIIFEEVVCDILLAGIHLFFRQHIDAFEKRQRDVEGSLS